MARFYTGEELEKRMNKELSIESIIEGSRTEENDGGEEILHYLIREQKNYKKAKKQTITKDDLERDDLLGEVLREYQVGLDQIRKDIHVKDGKKFLRSRAIYQIKNDMTYTKDVLKGTFGYHTHPVESTEYDLDFIDFTNPVHVKALLPLKMEFNPQQELSIILLDFQEVIERTDLTETERLIIEMMRDNMKNVDIGIEFGMNPTQIHRAIAKIVKKICKTSNE